MLGHDHTIHARRHHHGWDATHPPTLTVAPGETVEFEVIDSSGGSITPDTTAADLAN